MGMVFGWEREGERKVVGATSFLSSPFKIQFIQIREKIQVKSGKNIWTKLPPPLITFLAFFLFFLFFFLFFFFFLRKHFWMISYAIFEMSTFIYTQFFKKKYNVLLFVFLRRI